MYTLTFKALHGQTPSYITQLLEPRKSLRALRSSIRTYFMFLHLTLSIMVIGLFSIAAPRLWNSLPLHIRCIDTLTIFKSELKTVLFPK